MSSLTDIIVGFALVGLFLFLTRITEEKSWSWKFASVGGIVVATLYTILRAIGS